MRLRIITNSQGIFLVLFNDKNEEIGRYPARERIVTGYEFNGKKPVIDGEEIEFIAFVKGSSRRKIILLTSDDPVDFEGLLLD